MIDVNGLIVKAVNKTGFHRDFYNKDNVPTDPSNVMVITFFGDLRSLFVLSTLLLHRYKEQDKPSKYIILCSWPGFSSLFPYIDEYWSIQSDTHVKKLYSTANGFINNNELLGQYYRNLNQYFFEDVMDANYFHAYYDKGLTNLFWSKYREVKRFFPGIPSAAVMGKEFNKNFMEKGGIKVFVYPFQQISREFWVTLINRLLSENFTPVICKSFLTHDLSQEFSKSCIYFSEVDIGKVLSIMRLTGCVIDIFSGISRLALLARAPFIAVNERAKYVSYKEYELDDLCGINIPRKYIFSFLTNIVDSETWDFDILNPLIGRLKDFLPDRDKLPSTGQSLDTISYDVVREKKLKRIGTRLLKLPIID